MIFSFLGRPPHKHYPIMDNTPRPLNTYTVKARDGTVEDVEANYVTAEAGWVRFCIGGPYDQPVVTAFYEPISYRRAVKESAV